MHPAAAQPARTTNPMTRALAAAAVMYVGALGAQFIFPGLVLLVVYGAGPLVLGVLFASPGGTRETISANGYTAASAGGLAGVTWIATHPGDMSIGSVIVSCIATFLVLTIGSGVVVSLVSRRFRGEGDPPRVRARDEDDEDE
ncbi:MAG: hypothetical protein IT303_15140 [Dehalococcoidia bacterium]|nr:hypothetical protein [Dehalococcoidia bacterium]